MNEVKLLLKLKNKNGGWVGGQAGCERRIEVLVKIPKKKIGNSAGLVGGVRVDVNEEVK